MRFSRFHNPVQVVHPLMNKSRESLLAVQNEIIRKRVNLIVVVTETFLLF